MIDDRSSAPLAQLSDTNRGPLVLVATYIFLISSVLGVVVKTWTRLSTAKKMALTDWAMLVALVRRIYS
jgi:hypothetical protein